MLGRSGAGGLALLVGVAVGIAACGTSHPPPAGDGNGGSLPRADPQLGGGDGGARPPGCGVKDDGSACNCIDVPLFADPPNVYFVLDRSLSMRESAKWEHVRTTVGRVLRDIGPRASFGATVFPGLSDDSCGPSQEVMSLRPGDPPSSVDGPTTSFLLNATDTIPKGGTPTATALRDVLQRLQGVPGKTFVVLATDGGPNCNAALSCDYSTCIPNIEEAPGCSAAGPTSCCSGPEQCLDSAATTAAVASLKSSGVPVYVVGIPGSAFYAALLDDLATAGGTAQAGSAKYFRVDVAGDVELLATLRRVLAKIVATCTFTLRDPPADPALVNVYLDEVVEPKDATNGWTLEGSVVTLRGNACARVMNGDVLGVRVIAGCPSVIR
ncbi:MAG: CglB [Myxococcaceae bacterium]|nr:CglB [Myxococcaceae bacterium]